MGRRPRANKLKSLYSSLSSSTTNPIGFIHLYATRIIQLFCKYM